MKLYSIARSVFLIALGVTAGKAACVSDTPYAGCVHFAMRTDSSFYDNYTHFPTQATKDFMTSHFYRSQESYGFFENNLSWYPNAWAYINSYGITYGDSIVSQHPEYVLHDASGNPLYVGYACSGSSTTLGHCSRYAGNIANEGWRQYTIAQHLAILRRGYKGVWLDDVNLDLDSVLANNNTSGTQTTPIDTNTGSGMSQAAWLGYWATFLGEYNTAIAGAGFEIQENSVWFEGGRPAGMSTNQQAVITASKQWMNIERGVTDGGITGGSGDWSLRALFAYIDEVHAKGRYADIQNFVFSQSGGNVDYVPACYFLISTGLDLMGNDAITPNNWPANYDVDLGTPTGARYNFGNGIRRDFSRGFVIVTPPGTADTVFSLTAGQYTDVAGNPLTSIDIPASQGLIALSVTAPPPPTTLALSPSSGWTFGSTNVGTTSGSATISTTNSGTSNAVFSSVTLGGSNPGDFAIASNTCSGSLAPAASCNVTFTFTPTASGARSATLIFADSAASSPQSVPLSGTGVTVTNSISFSNPSWTFGSHPIGEASGNGSIKATNTGSNSFSFTSVAFTGTNPGDFAISANTCTGSLASASNCQVTFNFTPTGTGNRTANLTFTDGATGSPQTVPVNGTGASAPSALSFSSSSVAFGSFVTSTTSSPITITVTNTSANAVAFTSTALSGSNAADFAISSNTCTGTLSAGGTCTTALTFTPSAIGSRLASLTYTDNAAANPVSITTFGTVGSGGDDTAVFQAAINSTASSLNILSIPAGTYHVQPLTLPANANLLLASGATVQATATGYSSPTTVMLTPTGDNVTITGTPGSSIFKMLKTSYTDGSEYRHCIAIINRANITLNGISCNDSGGDGAYIAGTSANITLKNDTFNNNSRNAMSVISVNGLLVDNSTFSNTLGNPSGGSAPDGPWDGIDFEPNGITDQLQNVVIQNSFVTSNGRGCGGVQDCSGKAHGGNGIGILTANLNGSHPVSIAINNVASNGNLASGFFFANNTASGTMPTGTITLSNSSSTNDGQWGIVGYFWDYVAGKVSFTATNDTVVNPQRGYGVTTDTAAVGMAGGGGDSFDAGNFTVTGLNVTTTGQYYFNIAPTNSGSLHHITVSLGTVSGRTGSTNGLLLGSGVSSVSIP